MAVKARLAHCNLNEEEILERLCDLFLAPKPEPKERAKKRAEQVPTPAIAIPPAPPKAPAAAPKPAPPKSSASIQTASASSGKNIPASIKRKVLEPNQCENCGSHYALEVDHKLPRSLGGTHHPKNLRLLCRPCNQRAAIQILGLEKMQKYLG